MLDLGWTELLIIGIVALIVVGPKDLPVMFRTLGRFTGRLRAMARDFSRAMDEAADQSGARDVARDLRSMSNPRSAATRGFKKAAGLDDIEKAFDEEDDGAGSASPATGGAGETGDTDSDRARGPETAALAEKRAADAKARREDAVRRANERAASFRGFDGADAPESGTPAPAPGEDAPARRAGASPEPVGESGADADQDKA